jgi:Spy/CpxP family protein refolding chaperone
MKKTLVLLSLLCLTISVNAAEQKQEVYKPQKEIQIKKMDYRQHRDMVFEQRLGLTELQKLKAREIRKNGHENLKPILEEIKSKKQEAEMVRRSRMSVQMQEEKLIDIDKELRILEKKAQDIRRANMKEFESILTREQKRTLKNMKKEGRKRYHQAHPMMKPLIFKK